MIYWRIWIYGCLLRRKNVSRIIRFIIWVRKKRMSFFVFLILQYFIRSFQHFLLWFLVHFFRTLTKDKMTITYRQQNYKEIESKQSSEAVITVSTWIVFVFSLFFTIFHYRTSSNLKPEPWTVPRERIEPSDVWIVRSVEPLHHPRQNDWDWRWNCSKKCIYLKIRERQIDTHIHNVIGDIFCR